MILPNIRLSALDLEHEGTGLEARKYQSKQNRTIEAFNKREKTLRERGEHSPFVIELLKTQAFKQTFLATSNQPKHKRKNPSINPISVSDCDNHHIAPKIAESLVVPLDQ